MMEDIVAMAFTTMPFFVTSDKYHRAIWTNNHVVMTNHVCGLEL
jgi:hypothetical protein